MDQVLVLTVLNVVYNKWAGLKRGF